MHLTEEPEIGDAEQERNVSFFNISHRLTPYCETSKFYDFPATEAKREGNSVMSL